MGGVLPVLVHVHSLEGGLHPAAYLLGGNAQVLRTKGHVLLHHAGHQLVVGVLEHQAHLAADIQLGLLHAGVDAPYQDFPGSGHQHAVEELGHGGLAAAVVPQQGHKLPLLNGEVHPVEHLLGVHGFRVVGKAHLLGFDKCHGFTSRFLKQGGCPPLPT